ncbi:hypothetical protein EHQ46_06025 [Leptospira yanagawae]|uniref:Uncharacterized protein n=1 Tax=Leptospira yanagawae TaxID=293069 RepID=A0ABY2M6N7_9LEPT|nr:hypothetical protein [Leptospira yanagawae]TGL23072.1 hypothetical protein EHQ46_06025 [Leptospira yanagawae]
MNKEDIILKALYNLYKMQVVEFYKLGNGQSSFSASYVYAISNNCFPVFHASKDLEIYSDNFEIKKDYILEVITYLDDAYLNNKKLTFYGLEDYFGGKVNRSDLITIIRYSFLSERFKGNNFKQNLESESPIEGKDLDRPLDAYEI